MPTVILRDGELSRRWSASRAKMPPSPRLSARVMNERYLALTTSSSAQKISESTPNTPAARSLSGRCTRHSRNV